MKFCLSRSVVRRPFLSLFLSALVWSALSGCSAPSAEDHFASAQAYVTQGDEDAAIIELRNALKNNDSYLEARAQLADLLFASGDFRAAEADYGRALDALALAEANAPDSVSDPAATNGLRRRLTHAQWLCKIRLQQAAEVISELSRKSEAGDESTGSGNLQPDELALLGHARLALDDIELAQQDIADALTGDDTLSLAHFGQALIAWRSGDVQLASDSFKRAVELGTRDPLLLLTKADFELSQAELESARKTFALAQALPGKDLAANLGQVRVLIVEEDYAGATAALDAQLAEFPDLLAAVYLQGLVAYKQDELDTAQLYLRRVLSGKPDSAQALYLLGAVQFQTKDYLQAETNLSTYVSGTPGAGPGRKLLGAVRMQTGNYEGVIAALSPLAVASTDAQTLAMLGTAYARLGRLNEASEYLERAVTLAPDVGQLRNQLAVTLLAAGDSAQAIGQLESAIELESELQLSDYLLVLAQLRNGSVDDALLSAQALRERAPEDPMGENLLGAVYFAQGDVVAARASFESALLKNAAFQPAVLNLVRLELAEGDMDAAFAVLRRLLAADPDNERALLELAELELVTDSSRGAAEIVDRGTRAESRVRAKSYLKQAALAHPNSLAPKLALARLGLVEGDSKVALAESGEALRLAPDNPSVLALRIDSLLLAGESREAAGLLSLLSQRLRRPGSENYAQMLGLARLFERAGQRENAQSVYRSVEQAPAETPPEIRNQAALALAQIDLLEGDVGLARLRLAQLDASTRSSVRYRLLSADVAQAEGDIDSARSGYEELLGEDIREALFRLVAIHMRSETPQQADELLANWISAHPEDTEAELVMGTNLLGRKNYSQARVRFERALEASPNNVVILNNLAWLYHQTGDIRAREMAERAWALAPANADVADTYGWILLGIGELNLGSEVLVKANALAPDNLSIAFHAAKALSDTGRGERALAILKGFNLQEESAGSSAPFAGDSADRQAALTLLRKLVAVYDVETKAEEIDELIE